MKRCLLLLALISHSLYATTIIGSPSIEINPEGLYLVQIKISSTNNLNENDISITNFKSNDGLSDFNFESNSEVKQGGGHTTIPTKNILKIKKIKI